MPYIDYPYPRYPLDLIIGRYYDVELVSPLIPDTTLTLVSGNIYGMGYDGGTNRLTGTPMDCGRADFVIEARSNSNNTLIHTYAYSVGIFRLTISPSYTDAIVLTPYTPMSTVYFDVSVPNLSGFGPYTFDFLKEAVWSMPSGRIPKGLTLTFPAYGQSKLVNSLLL
jgi:hypothetical protein